MPTTTHIAMSILTATSLLIPCGMPPTYFYRATSQVNKWAKNGRCPKCEGTIIAEIPAGPGARQKALDIEASNAEGLRQAKQLRDPKLHQIP